MAQKTCANPLLLEWVKEWYETARERNSKGVTTYKHAYDSLKACPITFGHPASLQQLKGFGPKLCERLTEKLREHCEQNGLPMPPHPRSKKRASRPIPTPGEHDAEDEPARPAKKAKNAKPYVPAYRSGAYALVIALSSAGEEGRGMPKAELIAAAQPHCDASFTAPPDATKFYTAWSSMKTLLQKELVYERGHPLKRYCLTDEGWEVARRIQETVVSKASTSDASASSAAVGPSTSSAALLATSSRPTVASAVVIDDDDDDDDDITFQQPQKLEFGDVVADGTAVPDDAALPSFTPIRLAPGSFTVELVLDNREIRAKTDRDYVQEELAKRGIKPTVRALELGDVLWVARCKTPGWLARQGAEGDEVVLDWIVERKRLDDLIGSIRDGRFHEQKFRLRRSGVKNVIYLVEEISMDATHFQKYEEAVQSAMASMQVVDGYFLKRTQKMDDTIRYLASMTRMLKTMYERKTLHVIPTGVLTAKNYLPLVKHLRETQPSASHHISYPAFASLASKSSNMCLRDLFLKMLMCSKGVTGEKAIEIQKVWKTPNEFVKAYEQCGSGEEGKRRKMDLVSNRLGHLVGRKKISKAVSQKLAEVWGEV
ncbi:ERCC4 domain-containing protein [Achaetomium macrosporum]|uniref:Crossover junction endonuclease MUS81 n=1 Tax=Achaetomium macrosporum TaxID=79813 RepID=A0AAN7C595_9PEZI|nr:ERCC4 domain-containing protein [Achaetomium macrosporum]